MPWITKVSLNLKADQVLGQGSIRDRRPKATATAGAPTAEPTGFGALGGGSAENSLPLAAGVPENTRQGTARPDHSAHTAATLRGGVEESDDRERDPRLRRAGPGVVLHGPAPAARPPPPSRPPRPGRAGGGSPRWGAGRGGRAPARLYEWLLRKWGRGGGRASITQIQLQVSRLAVKSFAELQKPGISRAPGSFPRRELRRADRAGKSSVKRKGGAWSDGERDTYKGERSNPPPRELIRSRGVRSKITAVRAPAYEGAATV